MSNEKENPPLESALMAEHTRVVPWAIEAIVRAYEIGMLSYPTMANLIIYGKQKGDWK